MRLTRSDIAGFFRELRRRKVFRVAIGYGAAAWVTIEVSETLLPVLGAPDSAFPLVVALVALGFPIAMVLAWAFDITPEGVQRTPDVTPTPGPRRAAPPDACSIAALPFIDRSPDGHHQYLADGITEEIINGLARVKGYRVVGRTSAFAFRGREADARTIGDALGVACLVEGSMSVQGRRMRLHVQMVDTADGYASWSETFDRSIDDIFDLQEDIARSIVGALEGRARTGAGESEVSAAEPPSAVAQDGHLIDRSTASFEAYDLYLRGRVHWSERSPASLRRAIDFFRAALDEDPAFAHAHAGLADCYAVLLDYGLVAPADSLETAGHHAAEALRLAPELAEAHGSTAIVAQIEWRWDDSERGFERALELNPGYAVAHHRYALLLAWQSRFDEARDAIARGLRTDPLSPAIAAAIGWIHYFARDYDAAIRAERDALERFPGLGLARISLGLAQLASGEVDAAIESFRAVLDRLPDAHTADGSSLRSLLAHALARTGCTDDAERLIAILESGQPYASAYYRALPFIGLGRPDAALDRLEQAVDERCPQLIYIGTEPIVDPLRADPRFQRVLAAVGLPARTHA